MSGSSRARALPISATSCPASTRTPTRSRRFGRARCRSSSRGFRSSSPRTCAPAVSPSRATSADAVREADAVFIAVGTPSRRGDGYADLSYVYQAAREIAAVLDGYTVIVTKSTVPVGTGDEVERIIRETRAARPSSRSSRTRNSCARAPRSRTSSGPDRIVIGTEDERAKTVMTRAVPAALPQPARRSCSPRGARRS